MIPSAATTIWGAQQSREWTILRRLVLSSGDGTLALGVVRNGSPTPAIDRKFYVPAPTNSSDVWLARRRHISVSLLTHDIEKPQEVQCRPESGGIVRGLANWRVVT